MRRAKPGRADFKQQVAATKATATGAGLLAAALAKAADACPNASVAGMLRDLAEKGRGHVVEMPEVKESPKK